MTEVKICGITSIEDGGAAREAGADAVGFVFAPSPRRITPALAKRISESLVPGVARVGVFVNARLEYVRDVARTVPLDVVQLHGDESKEYAARLGLPFIKAFRARGARTLEEIREFGGPSFLLDAFVPGTRGGSGRRVDLELAGRAAEMGPMVLAGGLDRDNVARALARVGPAAVDVSSGVENGPGVKDPAMMAAFVSEVRIWDTRTNGVTSVPSAEGLFRRHCNPL